MSSVYLDEVMDYAQSVVDRWIMTCDEVRLACRRFLDDLECGRWDFRTEMADFCIMLTEELFCHQQGESLDGTPLRGKPFLLQPWHKFCEYNLCGFFLPGTQLRRFQEGLIFVPRKNVKTTWAAGFEWALANYYAASGSKVKDVGGSLKQTMEAFDFLKYNIKRLGLGSEGDPEEGLRILDSSQEHSISGELDDERFISIEALAYNPDKFDSFNANIVLLDELHVYRSPAPYNRLKEATKAYSNKLILGLSTAGDDGNGFCAQRVEYSVKVLKKIVTGPDADRFFAFVSRAPQRDNVAAPAITVRNKLEPEKPVDDKTVDFTDPFVQCQANPSYGVTIRPADLMADAMEAQNDPQLRKDFLTRSLNVFVSSLKAYFDIEMFRASDARYNWTIDDLAKLPIKWYGGSDLARLHDLTAGALVGEYKDVLIIIPHCWFPVVAAAEKADKDKIPLFGWMEDGWLDMSNDKSTNHAEIVRWYKKMRNMGFKIHQVGHDRKFCPEYVDAMKAAKFKVIDQPQLHYLKSQGFRHIEKKALNGKLYYCHAEPFEYCAGNIYAVEKEDDIVIYDKMSPNLRIDVFDAPVFGCVRMLTAMGKINTAARWFGDPEPTEET